jgi:hypothetical protein
MPNIPSSEELDTMFQAFKAVLAHPEFQKALEEVQGLPEDQRSQAVSTQLTSQALMTRGVPIHPGMSITTQNIEIPDDTTTRAVETETAQPGTTGAVVPLDGRVCFWVFGQRFCIEMPVFPFPLDL